MATVESFLQRLEGDRYYFNFGSLLNIISVIPTM